MSLHRGELDRWIPSLGPSAVGLYPAVENHIDCSSDIPTPAIPALRSRHSLVGPRAIALLASSPRFSFVQDDPMTVADACISSNPNPSPGTATLASLGTTCLRGNGVLLVHDVITGRDASWTF